MEVRDVAYSFGDRVALDGVTFEVTPGVLTGLLGPNGAGKTTLMRILLGVLTPDGGEVRLRRRRRRQTTTGSAWGYMPQERGLYPAMRPVTSSCYFGRLHGLSRAEAQRAAPGTCSRSSGSASAGTSARTGSPAACSSGCSSPPPWSTTPR